MEEKQQIIEYWKSHLRDLIPYNSPNYEEELQKWAESLYESINKKIDHYINNENL